MINDLEQFSVEELQKLASIGTYDISSYPSVGEVQALARIALAAKSKSIIVNLGESTKEEIDALVSRINSEKSVPFIHADKQAKPVIPNGWKLVPVEPTMHMLRESYRVSGVYSQSSYKAMLAAAPASEEL